MNYYHFITIFIGLAFLIPGFKAAFDAKKPYDIIGAFSAIVGLIIAVIGTLLLCVPDFFTSG